jgi:hypothetical protein
MPSKSSTFLAFVSVLTILAVVGVAINDSEKGKVRKPFPTPVVKNEKTVTVSDNNTPKETAIVENRVTIDNQGQIAYGLDPQAKKEINSAQILKGINNETLRKAGFQNFVIKPRPFNGILFEKFDLSMLGEMNVSQKTITQLKAGNEMEILNTYEFNAQDKSTADELFELLKLKAKGELGVSINQTNQFGLASFFINLSEPQKNAFLVVKTTDNVYALSYPKATLDENGNTDDFIKPVSELLKELM